ncbi:MAG: flagellar hook-length control protein FliK [Peptococcaceae bacterium]|nr:flagellar hook-length control protein FliK [Peptococcaceae bacterium]
MKTETVATSLEATVASLFQAPAGGSQAGPASGDFLLALMALIAQQDGTGKFQGENSGGGLFNQAFTLLDYPALMGCWPANITGLVAEDQVNGGNDQDSGQSSAESPPAVWWQLLPVLQDNPAAGQLVQILSGLSACRENPVLLPEQPQAVVAGNRYGLDQVRLMAGQVDMNPGMPVEEGAGYNPGTAVQPFRAQAAADAYGINQERPQAVPAGPLKSYAEAVVDEGRAVKPGQQVNVRETAVFPAAVEAEQAVEQGPGPVIVAVRPVKLEGGVIQREPDAGSYNADKAVQWERPGAVVEGQDTASADAGGDSPGTEFSGKNPAGAGVIQPRGGENSRDQVISTVTTHLSNITAGKLPEVIVPHLVNSLKQTVQDPGRVTVIRLKLEPESMGEISIRLSYAKGELTAHFYTASGVVKEAVECSLPQLRETLAQHNVNLGEAAAFVGHEQQGRNGADFRGYGYSRGVVSLNDGVQPEYHGEIAGSVYAGSGQNSLDLLV